MSEEQENKTYEVGYLLSPLIPIEALTERVAKTFKEPILTAGGEVLDDKLPQPLALSYPIKKQLDHQRLTFREAFFGSLRFKIEPAAAEKLAKQFKTSPDLIRDLIVEVPRAALLDEENQKARTKHVSRPAAKELKAKEAKSELPPAISETEVDEKIEQLLTVES